jgi:hypothetical protein
MKAKRTGGMAQEVEHLHGKGNALSPNSSRKGKEREKRKRL